ncbi:PRC-barrel domain-containing protein [Methylomonas sp. 2BW1-5-20]|uniref:PRC-barrel domain-containing protein n=1 Tax=Methylomonas sp. 2BW1-5-20 TaxID=3376686 RepID=UPI00405134FF
MSHQLKFANSPVKASNIIGTPIANPKGESLGDIKEVVIDPNSGRVAYAVVSFGGFLSMGEKLFAIPFSAFEYNLSKNQYILDVSKERLEKAPGFDADHWPSMEDEQWNRDVYDYYDRSPYWE